MTFIPAQRTGACGVGVCHLLLTAAADKLHCELPRLETAAWRISMVARIGEDTWQVTLRCQD